MHIALESEIFRTSQRHTGCRYTFDCGVVCEVGKKNRSFYRTRPTEIADKVFRFFERNTYRAENDGEFFVAAENFCLSRYLRGKFRMGKTAHRKYREFLTSDQSIESVYRRNTRLNKLVGVVAGGGVDGFAVDVEALFGDNGRAAVTGTSHTVKNSAQHVFRHRKFKPSAEETGFGSRNL